MLKIRWYLLVSHQPELVPGDSENNKVTLSQMDAVVLFTVGMGSTAMPNSLFAMRDHFRSGNRRSWNEKTLE
eukprot:328373-Amphidinium_carterae.2